MDHSIESNGFLPGDREFLKVLVENISDTVFVTDFEGRPIFASPNVISIFGITPKEALELDNLCPLLGDRLFDPALLDSKGLLPDIEHAVTAKDGKQRVLLTTVKKVSEGFQGILYTCRDITDRKRAEKALEEKTRHLERILDYGGSPMGIYDRKGRVLLLNRQAAGKMGGEPDDFIGKTIAELFPENGGMYMNRLEQAFSSRQETAYEDTVRLPTGERTLISRYISIPDARGEPSMVQINSEDVTALKRVQESLRESEAHLRAILESTSDLVSARDRDARLTYFNDAFGRIVERLFGVQARAGMNTMDFLPSDTRRHWENVIRRVLEGKKHREEFKHVFPNGEERWYDIFFNPVFRGGAVTGFTEFNRDITEKKAVVKSLKEARKREAVGTLAGGIAHEFNNALAIIIGNVDLILERLGRDNPVRENIDDILCACKRARDVVRQILTHVRPVSHNPHPVDFALLVSQSLELLQSTRPRNIEIIEAIDPDCGKILIDPGLVQPLVIHLVTNAFLAMPEGGTLHVRLERTEKGRIRFTVEDDGVGISESIIERIFDPFFTTRAVGSGNGMGLAVVQGIVQHNGGAISVKSTPDKGTVFEVEFPRVDPETETKDGRGPCPPGKGERIMLVDDEASIVRVYAGKLERLGYRVEGFSDPSEALERFRAAPDVFDLVLTDLSMPGLDGDRLLREILGIQEDIPVILYTGYPDRMNEEKAQSLGASGCLEKPLDFDTLCRSLRRAFEKRSR